MLDLSSVHLDADGNIRNDKGPLARPKAEVLRQRGSAEQGTSRLPRRTRVKVYVNRAMDRMQEDLQRQINELQGKLAERASIPDGGHRETEDVDAGYDTADACDIANIWSFCVEGVFQCASKGKLKGLIGNLCIPGLLICVQLIYAFGYMDASQMEQMKDLMIPGFFEHLHSSLFYPQSLIEGSIGVTVVQVLCSCASILLLAILIKDDMEGTLITAGPFEQLLLCPSPVVEGSRGSPSRLAAGIGRLFICLYLQALHLCRGVLIPVFATVGAAGNFASSASAQEIVLNSVAIGFVFELDEVLYKSLVNRRTRERFEAAPPRLSSPLFSPRCLKNIWRWAWATLLIDVGFSFWYYLFSIMPEAADASANHYYNQMVLYVFSRTAVLIFAQIHITRVHGARTMPVAEYMLRALLFAVLMVGMMALLYTCIFGFLLDSKLAVNPAAIMMDPVGAKCVAFQQEDDLECMTLHLAPGMYDSLRESSSVINDMMSRFRVWGVLPDEDVWSMIREARH